MFTGIIEELGIVEKIVPGTVMRLDVRAKLVLETTRIGDSICVNGVCLTVVSLGKKKLAFEVVKESQQQSTLGHLKAGDVVNLERALAVGGRLGGHFVSGHIDGVGIIKSHSNQEGEHWLVVKAHEKIVRFLAPKGSVTLDGISLTLVDVTPVSFCVALIPHTIETTNLRDKKPGSQLNIEVDMLAKYVYRLLNLDRAESSKINMDYLRQMGFDGTSDV